MSDTVEAMELPRVLTAVDRCDRCGAQAYISATLLSGMELLFCAHHFSDNHNDTALRNAGAKIHDERDKLVRT